MERKNIVQQLEEIAENVCNNFCKYRETCDESAECQWVRNGNQCPLDELH